MSKPEANLVNLVACEGGVGGHEEVTTGSGDEGGNDANEVIVHIARVSQRLGACGHDSCYLTTASSALHTLPHTPLTH